MANRKCLYQEGLAVSLWDSQPLPFVRRQADLITERDIMMRSFYVPILLGLVLTISPGTANADKGHLAFRMVKGTPLLEFVPQFKMDKLAGGEFLAMQVFVAPKGGLAVEDPQVVSAGGKTSVYGDSVTQQSIMLVNVTQIVKGKTTEAGVRLTVIDKKGAFIRSGVPMRLSLRSPASGQFNLKKIGAASDWKIRVSATIGIVTLKDGESRHVRPLTPVSEIEIDANDAPWERLEALDQLLGKLNSRLHLAELSKLKSLRIKTMIVPGLMPLNSNETYGGVVKALGKPTNIVRERLEGDNRWVDWLCYDKVQFAIPAGEDETAKIVRLKIWVQDLVSEWEGKSIEKKDPPKGVAKKEPPEPKDVAEDRAASALRVAKAGLKAKDPKVRELSKDDLKTIIRKYPDTTAAKEAEKLLKDLE